MAIVRSAARTPAHHVVRLQLGGLARPPRSRLVKARLTRYSKVLYREAGTSEGSISRGSFASHCTPPFSFGQETLDVACPVYDMDDFDAIAFGSVENQPLLKILNRPSLHALPCTPGAGKSPATLWDEWSNGASTLAGFGAGADMLPQVSPHLRCDLYRVT